MTSRAELTEEQLREADAFRAQVEVVTGYPLPRTIDEEVVRRTGKGEISPVLIESLRLIFERFGEPNGQVLLAFASLWNGCTYCSRAHVLAANMLFYSESGRLFPISEETMLQLMGKRDDEALAEVDRLLGDEYAQLAGLLRRQYVLREGQDLRPQPDDPWLDLALKAWTTFNEASIAAFEQDVDIFPGLGCKQLQDRDLMNRYREARASAGS